MRHIITTSIALPVGYKHGPRCDTKYAIHFALDKNLPSNIHLQPGMHYNWHYHDDWEDDTILNIIDWENETVLSNLIKQPQNNPTRTNHRKRRWRTRRLGPQHPKIRLPNMPRRRGCVVNFNQHRNHQNQQPTTNMETTPPTPRRPQHNRQSPHSDNKHPNKPEV